jgi:hypothetical protein
MFDRLLSFVVAVSLALLVWLYARSRDQEMLDNVPIPVEVVLNPRQADNYNLEVASPVQVPVSFTGPPQRIKELQAMLQRKELHVVVTLTVPAERLDQARFSDVAQVEPSMIHAPIGVTAIVPEGRGRIPYTLHRLVERRLPVRFVCMREAPAGPIVLDPPSVLVRGPREVLDRAIDLPTQPSDLPTRPLHSPGAPAVGRVALETTLEGRPIRAYPPRVLVRVPSQSQKQYELTDLPVQFLCPPNFALRPKFIDEQAGKVSLKLVGPARNEPPQVFAYVDLTKGKFTSGLNHEPLRLQLPRDFQLAQPAPRVVAFELVPADFVPGGLDRGVSPP